MTSATQYDLVSAIFRCTDGAADADGWGAARSPTFARAKHHPGMVHMNKAAAANILAALEPIPAQRAPEGVSTALDTSQWARDCESQHYYRIYPAPD